MCPHLTQLHVWTYSPNYPEVTTLPALAKESLTIEESLQSQYSSVAASIDLLQGLRHIEVDVCGCVPPCQQMPGWTLPPCRFGPQLTKLRLRFGQLSKEALPWPDLPTSLQDLTCWQAVPDISQYTALTRLDCFSVDTR